MEIWERQQDEGSAEYDAFILYLNMGGERSVRKVARELDKSVTLIGRWSSEHSWVSRAAVYDSSIVRAARDQAIDHYYSMIGHSIETGTRLQQIGLDALENRDTADISTKDALELIKTGQELEATYKGLLLDIRNEQEFRLLDKYGD